MECYESPANQFVVSFIGSPSMNFSETTVHRHYGEFRFKHEGFEYALDADATDINNGVDRVVLGILPEDIRLVEEADDPIDAKIGVKEPVGDVSHVYLKIGGDQCTATFADASVFAASDRIQVAFPEESLHLFDADTGEAIPNRRRLTAKVELEI